MNAQGPDTDGVETDPSTHMIANVMMIRAIKPIGAHPVVHPYAVRTQSAYLAV